MKRIKPETWEESLAAKREFEIMSKLDHPFIGNLVEVYQSESQKDLNLVLPYYGGGDLFDIMETKKKFPEQQVARIVH